MEGEGRGVQKEDGDGGTPVFSQETGHQEQGDQGIII